MNKKNITIIAILLIIGLTYSINIALKNREGDVNLKLVECLDKKGVVIYGTPTCPACTYLAESLGGYKIIDKIFIDCIESNERCNREMKTGFVPEIQIRGVLYEGDTIPESLAQEVNCKL
jgi:hypothetical protein